MVLRFLASFDRPLYIDTAAIWAIRRDSDNDIWISTVGRDGADNLFIRRGYSLMFNGVKIEYDKSVESMAKIIDIMGEIMLLEREDTVWDMGKLLEIGKKKKRERSSRQ